MSFFFLLFRKGFSHLIDMVLSNFQGCNSARYFGVLYRLRQNYIYYVYRCESVLASISSAQRRKIARFKGGVSKGWKGRKQKKTGISGIFVDVFYELFVTFRFWNQFLKYWFNRQQPKKVFHKKLENQLLNSKVVQILHALLFLLLRQRSCFF